MEYVKVLNFLGAEMRQLPCIPGAGAPTSTTPGAVGDLYIDVNTSAIYKCTAASSGVYAWAPTEGYTKEEIDKKGYQTQAQVQVLIETAISNIPDYNGEVEDV